MIIVRSPLRVSLGGGGTDLPSYYEEHEGFLIAAAINRYVYVSVSRPFREGIILKYSKIEEVSSVSEINHPLFREVLATLNLKTPQIEVSSFSDIPAGTGLGSSGSYTTALIRALYLHYSKQIEPAEIAALACQIEIEKLKEPTGKQDQYISTYGGIREFNFHKNGTVTSELLDLQQQTLHNLEDNLLLFYTGISRSASLLLKDQNDKTLINNSKMIGNLHYIKELGVKSKNALLSGDTQLFGELLHEHWEHKRHRTHGMTNSFIDEVYMKAVNNGAIGGKLVGAGGGGFLLFYANDSEMLREKMQELGLEEVRFKFDSEGTKVLFT
jgi:D-glycero-alpha-D-manno-heptose-7-phosphate kinase